MWKMTIDTLTNYDLDNGWGDVGLHFSEPPRQRVKRLPTGDIVHWGRGKGRKLLQRYSNLHT